jgi:hypothetical protein
MPDTVTSLPSPISAGKDSAHKPIKLSPPLIDQEGTEHQTIELTEPTGRQWDDIGKPFSMIMDGEDQQIEINNKKLTRYVSAVTGIDTAVLYTLPRSKLQECQDQMMSFFGEADTVS